jgi:hypothetical protein
MGTHEHMLGLRHGSLSPGSSSKHQRGTRYLHHKFDCPKAVALLVSAMCVIDGHMTNEKRESLTWFTFNASASCWAPETPIWLHARPTLVVVYNVCPCGTPQGLSSVSLSPGSPSKHTPDVGHLYHGSDWMRDLMWLVSMIASQCENIIALTTVGLSHVVHIQCIRQMLGTCITNFVVQKLQRG